MEQRRRAWVTPQISGSLWSEGPLARRWRLVRPNAGSARGAGGGRGPGPFLLRPLARLELGRCRLTIMAVHDGARGKARPRCAISVSIALRPCGRRREEKGNDEISESQRHVSAPMRGRPRQAATLEGERLGKSFQRVGASGNPTPSAHPIWRRSLCAATHSSGDERATRSGRRPGGRSTPRPLSPRTSPCPVRRRCSADG